MNTLKKAAWLVLMIAMLTFPAVTANANSFSDYYDSNATQYDGDFQGLGIKTAVFLGFSTANYDTFVRDDDQNSPFFETGSNHSAFGATFSYLNDDTPADSFFTRAVRNHPTDTSQLGTNDRYQAYQLNQDFTISHNGQDITLVAGDIVIGYEDYHDNDYNDMVVLLTTRDASQVPIPGAVWLLGSGMIGLIGIRRRKRA